MSTSQSLTPKELELLKSKHPIIAIVGQTGAGKSTFINLISSDKQKVSDDDDINSCTDRIHIVGAKIHGKSVILIDSPGIDDTSKGKTETDVFIEIANSLAALGKRERWVTGILFLHCITDKKFRPSARRISLMLEKLCGERAMNRLMICTTQWDDVSTTEGDKRHARICGDPWKVMIDQGARTTKHSSRWDNAQTNAEAIVSTLIKDAKPGPFAVDEEMNEEGKTADQTAAGRELDSRLKADREHYERMTEEILRELRALRASLADLARLRDELGEARREIDRLKKEHIKLQHAYDRSQALGK